MNLKTPSNRSKLYNELIRKSWWAILFLLLCLFAFDSAMKKREQEEERLKQKLLDLAYEKEKLYKKCIDLQDQISSQDDPAWVELTLIRCLGLVPEGQKKVIFISPDK